MQNAIKSHLPLAEIFGPVWQGEGPHAGQLCHFLRLGRCNLACNFCDTAWTWDSQKYDLQQNCPPTPTIQIIDRIKTHNPRLLIVTGGEPLMHQNRGLTEIVKQANCPVHIETNGTIMPTEQLATAATYFNVSPKIILQGDPEKKRIKIKPLQAFAKLAESGKACFKIVAFTSQQIDQAAHLMKQLRVPPESTWIMPEGQDEKTLLKNARAIAGRTAAHGFNLTLRQQTLMYGNEKGK